VGHGRNTPHAVLVRLETSSIFVRHCDFAPSLRHVLTPKKTSIFLQKSQAFHFPILRPTMSPVRPPMVFVLFALLAVLAVQVAARIHTLPIHVSYLHILFLPNFLILTNNCNKWRHCCCCYCHHCIRVERRSAVHSVDHFWIFSWRLIGSGNSRLLPGSRQPKWNRE